MDAGALSKPLAVGTLSTASASSSFTVEVYRSFLKRACKVSVLTTGNILLYIVACQ